MRHIMVRNSDHLPPCKPWHRNSAESIQIANVRSGKKGEGFVPKQETGIEAPDKAQLL